ncbi:MAG: hypothetical protein ACRENA_12280 [Vulcanimicrobiaceae bacterium]
MIERTHKSLEISCRKKRQAGNSWKTGGATVWTTPAIDPKLGLVIFSTSNPNPDLSGGTRRPYGQTEVYPRIRQSCATAATTRP